MSDHHPDPPAFPETRPAWASMPLPDRCANLECDNRPGEGAFVLVEERRRDDGGKPMRLLMCAPCAAVMRGDAW